MHLVYFRVLYSVGILVTYMVGIVFVILLQIKNIIVLPTSEFLLPIQLLRTRYRCCDFAFLQSLSYYDISWLETGVTEIGILGIGLNKWTWIQIGRYSKPLSLSYLRRYLVTYVSLWRRYLINFTCSEFVAVLIDTLQ